MDQAVLMYGLPAEDFAQGFVAQEQTGEAEGNGPLWLHGMDTEEATADQPFGVVAAEPLQQWTPGEDYGMKPERYNIRQGQAGVGVWYQGVYSGASHLQGQHVVHCHQIDVHGMLCDGSK